MMTGIIKGARWAGICCAVGMLVLPAGAQDNGQSTRPSLGEAISRALDQIRPALDLAQETPEVSTLIDFENVQGPADGVGISLTNQYRESHGLTFGKGVSVHFCARVTDDVMASLCPYPQAASGRRAAAFDPRSGGTNAMEINFDRPVKAITMRINPTGGQLDEVFGFVMTGFDANGNRASRRVVEFNWFQDAFSWPTSASLQADNVAFSRVTLEMQRRAVGSRAVRFLIDDLGIEFAPEDQGGPAPLAEVIFDRDQSRPVGEPEIIIQPEEETQSTRIFKRAPKVRLPIDWDHARAIVAEQKNRGLEAAPIINGREVQRAQLPLVLPPMQVDGNSPKVDLAVQSTGDSYSAAYKVGDEHYEIYGTRAFTMVGKRRSNAPLGVVISKTPTVWTAKFSAFGGASYRVVRICDTGTAAGDKACTERDDMKDRVSEMLVVLGPRAGGQP